MKVSWLATSSAAAALVLAYPASARADVEAADKAIAEALFRRGKELLVAGNVAEACPKFAESQRIDPQLGTVLFLATCHEQEKKTASAWAEFSTVLTLLARVHQPDRENYAREHMAALQKKLSYLIIIGPPAPSSEGSEVRLDGKPLGTATFGIPIPMDPGEHQVEAAAPNKKAWSRVVSIGPGPSETTVRVPSLVGVDDPEAAGSKGSPEAQAHSADAPVRHDPAGDNDTSNARGRALGYVAAGVGVVGIGVGIFFGLETLSKKNEADDGNCVGSFCTQKGLDLYTDARAASVVSTVGFAAGAVGLGLGTFLLLHFKSRATGPTMSVSAAPFGARVGGAW